MVNMNQLYFMLMAFFVLQGCVQKGSDSYGESLPYIVDIEECLEKEHPIKLSEIADTIEYLELKTPDDLIITGIYKIMPVEDFLLIKASQILYKFTHNGDYICTIGGKGQGPGEYTRVYDFDVDFGCEPAGEILLASGSH